MDADDNSIKTSSLRAHRGVAISSHVIRDRHVADAPRDDDHVFYAYHHSEEAFLELLVIFS